MTEIPMEATVTKVQVADDLSLLTNEAAINNGSVCESWKELTGPDGKLIPDTRSYIKNGDGIHTMPEIVRTEEYPIRLVYVEAEYTNMGSETAHDVWYMASLLPVVKEGGTYKIFDRTDDTCDCVENEHSGVGYEMAYADVSGSQNPENYIPEIKPGESVTISFAWLVSADELDKLHLSLNGALDFSEEGLEIGFVDLKL